MPLIPDDFSAFFGELYKDQAGEPLSPFPWQRRLAKRVCEGGWPACIAVPTASGKTACIDIAVFALACQADLGDRRTAPRRIFFVVDRRVIVDEAFHRAVKLAGKLKDADTGILKRVADQLRKLNGKEKSSPLECCELRGGIYRDNVWVRTPLQPTVICTTVDQIGSRLLFRGYGISPLVAPVHAAMVANDSLIVLDEAHCSNPFRQTVESTQRYRAWAEEPLKSPSLFVTMSATPGHQFEPDNVVRLETSDREHPVLRPRLTSSKQTRIAVADKAKGGQALEQLAEFIARQAKALVKDDIKAVGIIVNRVATAGMIYKRLKNESGQDAVLLTGRMRPYDKDRTIAKWQERIEAKPGRPPLERPVFIVSTQCLEVGANLDFDALISECASLDALRQRFGRLNRLGLRQTAPGMIAVQKAQEDDSQDDPIYGGKLSETWKWLAENAIDNSIDMGVAAIDALLERSNRDASTLSAEQPDAPVMLPAYVDRWVQTAPIPCPDPDVSLFLHGPGKNAAEVQVVWRADLGTQADENEWLRTVSLCPPTVQECLPVQLHVLRKWWRGAGSPSNEATDIEGVRVQEEDNKRPAATVERRGLIWRGLDRSRILTNPDEIAPGDTLVLPQSESGWEVLGYIPQDDCNEGGCVDIAELVERPIPVLRVHKSLESLWIGCPKYERLLAIAEDPLIREDAAVRETLRDLAAEAKAASRPQALTKLLEQLADDRRLSINPYPEDEDRDEWRGMVLSGSKPQAIPRGLFSDEDDTSSNGASPVELTEHNKAVAKLAEKFARLCGFSEDLCQGIREASSVHDVGKADLRFQAWLHGGNRRKAEAAGSLLAKSIEMPRNSSEYETARRKSGYPKGGRHELLSVRLAECDGVATEQTAHRELILHLIGAHHGHCRPFAPVVEDPAPETVEWDGSSANSATGLERLDSGVAARFWRMVRRYGWWGAAYLEAIVRLADWCISEKGQDKGRRS
jgi:CRISPR-associated endonuclease/helicase Cas3